jgi:heme exporter protein C
MLLRTSIDDLRRADRSSAVFALVGVVNVPIIYYSVQWWNTLHQGASVSMATGSKMAATMLMAMLIMTIAFWMYSIAVILARVRCVMIERESLPTWDDKPAVIHEAVEAR